MIRGIPRHYRSRVTSFSYQSLMPAAAGTPRYENGCPSRGSVWVSFVPPLHLPWIPAPYRDTGRALAASTKWGRRVDVGGGIAVDVLSRNVSAWIPAFAGMTNGEAVECRHTRGRVTSLSYQSLIPVGTGTPRYEKPELWLGTANWRRGFCHALPPPQRGTSPSPREVFDRTTFPIPTPSGFRPSPE